MLRAFEHQSKAVPVGRRDAALVRDEQRDTHPARVLGRAVANALYGTSLRAEGQLQKLRDHLGRHVVDVLATAVGEGFVDLPCKLSEKLQWPTQVPLGSVERCSGAQVGQPGQPGGPELAPAVPIVPLALE